MLHINQLFLFKKELNEEADILNIHYFRVLFHTCWCWSYSKSGK